MKYENLTPEQKKYIIDNVYNGVGSGQFGFKVKEFIFRESAIEHDFYYFRGGTEQDRKTADIIFLNHSLRLASSHTFLNKIAYRIIAYIFFYFVYYFGWLSWEYYDSPANTWEEFLLQHEATKLREEQRTYILKRLWLFFFRK